MQTQRKAKRKLSNISFEQDGAHIALVSKDQGHGANGHHYALVMKAANFSEEFIQKAQRIKVEMELPEFLQRFYGMWCEDDAKELAKLFGWVDYEEQLDSIEDALEGERTVEVLDVSPIDYIKTKLEDSDLLVEAAQAQDLASMLAGLSEDQYLSLLQMQESVEKAMKKQQRKSKPKAKTTAAYAGQPTGEVAPAFAVTAAVAKATDNITNEVEKSMQTNQVAEATGVELIEKSAVVALEKALSEQKELLEKALAQVAQYEAEKKEQINKSRKAAVVDAVKDEAKAEILFKAFINLESAEFDSAVDVLKSLVSSVDQSQLFVEKGLAIEEELEIADAQQESELAKLLKSRFQPK